MFDINLFSKKEKELNTERNNKNLQPGYRNGIWHREMCHTQ